MRSPVPAREDAPHHRGTTVTGRQKGTLNQPWLVVSDIGQLYLEEVGKQAIMRRTGLPARDLHVLDPLLSYPAMILGRERVIIINLEQIKAIVTATEVFIVNSKDPLVVPFVQDLLSRVTSSNRGPQQIFNARQLALKLIANVTYGYTAVGLSGRMLGNFL